MTISFARWPTIAFAVGSLTLLAAGCAEQAGYGYQGGVGIGADYYEPYGGDYGGWGDGYDVGPYYGGGHRSHEGRSIPSLPSGGGRGFGGGGSGGHGFGGGGGHGGGGRR